MVSYAPSGLWSVRIWESEKVFMEASEVIGEVPPPPNPWLLSLSLHSLFSIFLFFFSFFSFFRESEESSLDS